ncbi:unnamed protein product, partial [Owenia fusiformis]
YLILWYKRSHLIEMNRAQPHTPTGSSQPVYSTARRLSLAPRPRRSLLSWSSQESPIEHEEFQDQDDDCFDHNEYGSGSESKKDSLESLPETKEVTKAPGYPDFPVQPFKIGNSLQKLRQENLAKKRRESSPKMPELAENENDGDPKAVHAEPEDDINGKSDDAVHVNGESREGQENGSSFPNLPNAFLKKLGLNGADKEKSAEHLNDQELEEKFVGISLAFKTDRLTLEKRLELQERQRNIAEENIDQELDGLKEALKSLHTMCMDNESVQIYQRLQHHIEVLAQTTNRMSSRAEVLGAVHQERRLSTAIEVMVQHTENLKRLYEREHHELEETRRILQENNLYTPSTSPDIAGEYTIGKRSMSVTGGATSLKGTRRRASVAVGALGRQASVSNDPKSRFQNIVASTSAGNKNSIFSVVRRASMADKGDNSPTGQSELSPILSSPTLEKTQELNHNDIKESLQPVVVSNGPTSASIATITSSTLATPSTQGTTLVRRSITYSKDGSDKSTDHKPNEEEIFQKGYEEGIKAKVSQDLEDLREQQKVFCDTLEDLMDQSEIAEQMEACESRETFIEKVLKIKPRVELIYSKFSWDKSGKQMRYFLACILFGLAVLTVLFTLIPGVAATASNTDTSVEEMPQPHISVRNYRAPPS